MTCGKSIATCLAKHVDFKGRASRSEFKPRYRVGTPSDDSLAIDIPTSSYFQPSASRARRRQNPSRPPTLGCPGTPSRCAGDPLACLGGASRRLHLRVLRYFPRLLLLSAYVESAPVRGRSGGAAGGCGWLFVSATNGDSRSSGSDADQSRDRQLRHQSAVNRR